MEIIRKVGGILVILFGVHITGLVPISLLFGEKRLNLRHKPAGYLGSFLVGLAFAAGWTPCIGPILASILMVAATEEKVSHGIILLLLYSIGLGIPFLLSSLALHRFILFLIVSKTYQVVRDCYRPVPDAGGGSDFYQLALTACRVCQPAVHEKLIWSKPTVHNILFNWRLPN